MLVAAIPEVFKRRLYRKYGFGSIHEFGAKVGGLSHRVVNDAIYVHEKTKDKPELQKQIIKQGLNKVRVVMNIATPGSDKEWAEKVNRMTKAALETHVRDKKFTPGSKLEEGSSAQLSLDDEQNSLFGTTSGPSTLDYMSSRDPFAVNLDPKVIQQLQILKANMKKGTTWNDVFRELLKNRKQKKQRARGLKAKCESICEKPSCNKPAIEIHHKNHWAITKKHENLESLCRPHHELEHQTNCNVDRKFHLYKWQTLKC